MLGWVMAMPAKWKDEGGGALKKEEQVQTH
jgi:hypothetical protein